MIPYVPKLIRSSNELKINDLYVPNVSKNTSIDFSNLWEDYINKEKLNQENMKNKKVSEKENEWKGVLQNNSKTAYLIPSNSRTPLECKVNTNLDKLPKGYELSNKNPNIAVPNYTKHLSSWKDMYTHNMFSNNKLGYDEEDIKRIKILEWDNFTKDKTLSGEEEHCNVGVNKDWNFTKEELNKFYHDNWVKENVNYKQKRVDFEFTPLTFWQLFPSVAINLHCKEIELTWLCFGMYINFKRNG